MPVPVPATPADLTPDWLTEALREGGHLAAGSVSTLTVDEIGIGRGYVGLTLRLRPTYDGPADAPRSFVIKLPHFMELANEYDRAQVTMLYGTEIRWYREFAADCPVRVPRCYWTGMDEAAGRFAVLLEDLGNLRVTDQISSCSPEDARLVVDELARMHSRWWNDPALPRDWLLGPLEAGVLVQYAFMQGWEAFWRRFGPSLPAEYEAIGAATGPLIPSLFQQGCEGRMTLVHGDFRLENFMLGEPGTRDALCVLDWQLVSRGGGAYDLAYFLSQSLTTDARRAQEADLLRRYHEGLVAGGVADYGFERFYEDFRRGLLCTMFIPVNGARTFEEMALGGASGQGGRAFTDEERNLFERALVSGEALMAEIARRNVAAILDHRSAELL